MAADTVVARAQSTTALPSYGIHVGFAASRLSGEDVRSSWLSSFVIGGYVEKRLSDGWSLQPEVLYIGKGEQLTVITPGFGPYATEARTQYVELPVLVRRNIASSDPAVRPFVQLGPQVSIRVGCGFLAHCSGFAFNTSTVDYGAVAGVGVDMRVRDQGVSFVVRIDAGMRNIEADRAMRNRTVEALLGFRL